MQFNTLVPKQWNAFNEPVPYNTDFGFLNMDRFLNHLDKTFFDDSRSNFHFTLDQNNFPKVDVMETKDELLISAELPGMDENDISVTLDEGTLVIKGEKKMSTEVSQKEFHEAERSYGSFQRSFHVPETIDQNKIDACFTKGVLTLKLPKAPEERKNVIAIPINK